jgi:hypothetical protein
MYRIRTAAGSEANYNSLEEFTVAVRRGLVAPEDEIFHTRAGRWLDVKSHPHYRSALDGPASAAPSAPVASPSQTQHRPVLVQPHAAPAPRPAQVPSPATAQPQARAQVFERPAAPAQRPAAQTEVHPRLQANPAPVAAAPAPPKLEIVPPASYAPPAKSKDLTFVDTGVAPTVGKPHTAPAVDVAPPPPRTELRPAAKPAPIAKDAGSDLDFLIMDGGIESPVRTSAGFKTIPEDFTLLNEGESVEPHAPSLSTTGKSAALTPRSGKQHAVVIPPEAPAIPAVPAPSPLASLTPVPEEVAAEPQAPPAVNHAPATSWATGARTSYLGGGIALVVIAVGLLAWKPWQGNGTPASTAAQTARQQPESVYDPSPNSLVTPVSATTPPPLGNLTGAGAVVPPNGSKTTAENPKAVEAKPAAVDSAKKEEVVLAARPEFGGGMPVGEISLGADVPAKSTASAVAPSELVRRLNSAQKDAQLDLNGRLVSLGFRGVINPARLGSPALVAAARTAWSGGVDAIRTYRSRIARIEKAYEDSVLTSQRAQRWSGEEMRAWTTRQSLSEPSDASQLSDLMFTQVGEGLELLASTDFTIKGDKITFKDAGSATRYTSIRGWVEQRMATWSSTPESARPYSISATLRALGDGFPTVE